jgi:hypothetical protein
MYYRENDCLSKDLYEENIWWISRGRYTHPMKQYIVFISIIFLITFCAVCLWGVEELDNKRINLPNTYIFSDKNQVPITYIANSYGWFTPYT